MDNLPLQIIKIARPIHWVKNLALFAALFLTGQFFDKNQFIQVAWGFVIFCLATSATYIFNDIVDAPNDRLHPIKKFRPIASGSLPVTIAIIEAVGFLAGAVDS